MAGCASSPYGPSPSSTAGRSSASRHSLMTKRDTALSTELSGSWGSQLALWAFGKPDERQEVNAAGHLVKDIAADRDRASIDALARQAHMVALRDGRQ